VVERVFGAAAQNACSGRGRTDSRQAGSMLDRQSCRVVYCYRSDREVASGRRRVVRLTIYAGAVWAHCSPVEVERLTVSSYEEAVERLTSWIDWLPPEEAERIALEAIESEDYVLAGYANELLGLRAEPPEDAEPCDRSRLGDTVYVVGDEYWEPFYVYASLEEG
jgi:hypothetical protein